MKKPEELKVLIVDDSITIRKIVSLNLEKVGITKYSQAKDGEEGFRMAASEQFDIIFTDHNMSGLNGLAMVKKLRAHPKGAQTNIIAMSSELNEKLRQEYGDHGVRRFIHKPFTIDTFNEIVSSIVNGDGDGCKTWDRPTAEQLHTLLQRDSYCMKTEGESLVIDFGDCKLELDKKILSEHGRLHNMLELS